MNPPYAPIDLYSESLVAELHRLGVRHLARLVETEPDSQPIPPATLIRALIQSEDARLQAALILLFLRRPAYSLALPQALSALPDELALEVKLYYQAALYLQPDLQSLLGRSIINWQALPDLFSESLSLPVPGSIDMGDALQALGALHAQVSGLACNWSDSYRQNIPRFLKHLEHDNRRYRARATEALPG
jgi:hypothetical protein